MFAFKGFAVSIQVSYQIKEFSSFCLIIKVTLFSQLKKKKVDIENKNKSPTCSPTTSPAHPPPQPSSFSSLFLSIQEVFDFSWQQYCILVCDLRLVDHSEPPFPLLPHRIIVRILCDDSCGVLSRVTGVWWAFNKRN